MTAFTTPQGANSEMRKILSLAAVLALAACGGGGGSSPTSPPPPQQTTAPTGNFVTPQFTIVVPNGTTSSSAQRKPNYVSSASLSVVITLTATSNGIDPTTVSGNPATSTISSGACNTGCTVNGPPSPPGTDSFRIVTYDNSVPASGHALNAGQIIGAVITAGQNNPQSVTLGAIPKTLSISGVPSGGGALTAGTQSQTATISVVAVDGHGDTIPTGKTPNVFYVDATGAALNVTVLDQDTNSHGSCVVNSGTSACTTGGTTSVTFSGPDITRVLAYDGLAENPVTLTASASGATNGTATFQPKLNAPVFVSAQATPAPVALSSSPEVDLFAPTGVGSVGTESFTESGWTNSVYGHALTFSNTGACTTGTGITATSMDDIATITVGTNDTTTGTPITATTKTTSGAPKPGSCPSVISDGLGTSTGGSNTTGSSITLTVTYTTSTVTGSSKGRH